MDGIREVERLVHERVWHFVAHLDEDAVDPQLDGRDALAVEDVRFDRGEAGQRVCVARVKDRQFGGGTINEHDHLARRSRGAPASLRRIRDDDQAMAPIGPCIGIPRNREAVCLIDLGGCDTSVVYKEMDRR